MTPDDIRKLADNMDAEGRITGREFAVLRACADVVEACGIERHTCNGKNRRMPNCAICKALARLEAP